MFAVKSARSKTAKATLTVAACLAYSYMVTQHLQALLRLDTTNPPGNESLAAGYLQAQLAEVGINYDAMTRQLLDEGGKLFSDAFDKLMTVLEGKRDQLLAGMRAGD